MTKNTSYGRIKTTTIGGIFIPRRKGTHNTPQKIIDEIVRKHREGESQQRHYKSINMKTKD